MDVSKFKEGRVYFRNTGVKGLRAGIVSSYIIQIFRVDMVKSFTDAM